MLGGRPTVFLSCSEKFRVSVARPVREYLGSNGVFGVIVSDEPFLPHTPPDPESKVESYMDASDAFVALCTPDDRLADGTVQTRQNIVDEHQRASKKAHLRHRILVFKDPSVKLPSNINPTHEPLNIENASQIGELVLRQLRSWGILEGAQSTPHVKPVSRPAMVARLVRALGPGEHGEARRRVYQMISTQTRSESQAVVSEIRRFLRDAEDLEDIHPAMMILEAINQLDSQLIDADFIEELATARSYSERSTAALILWDRAIANPGSVPLGLVGRLAQPATEDWYVFAPALAAAKQLLLHRRAARIIFDGLCASEDVYDRSAAANALLDVASVDRRAVPHDLAKLLADDVDGSVSATGREVLEAVGSEEAHAEERDPLSPFGL